MPEFLPEIFPFDPDLIAGEIALRVRDIPQFFNFKFKPKLFRKYKLP